MEFSLQNLISQEMLLFEEQLSKVFSPTSRLHEAVIYSLFAGGKRIRPFFTLHVSNILSGDSRKSLTLAIALELLHTYSLIHDDLPALDNDNLRRGLPTCHVLFGEDVAILAGDALLNSAFAHILGPQSCLSDGEKVLACSLMSHYAGIDGMLLGQEMDMNLMRFFSNGNGGVNVDQILLMHKLKTSGLFELSFAFAAIAANLDEEKSMELKKIGSTMGDFYQLADDVDDYAEDKEMNNIVSVLGLDPTINLLEQKRTELIKMNKSILSSDPIIHSILSNYGLRRSLDQNFDKDIGIE